MTKEIKLQKLCANDNGFGIGETQDHIVVIIPKKNYKKANEPNKSNYWGSAGLEKGFEDYGYLQIKVGEKKPEAPKMPKEVKKALGALQGLTPEQLAALMSALNNNAAATK